jgi:hypothetical protein
MLLWSKQQVNLDTALARISPIVYGPNKNMRLAEATQSALIV